MKRHNIDEQRFSLTSKGEHLATNTTRSQYLCPSVFSSETLILGERGCAVRQTVVLLG